MTYISKTFSLAKTCNSLSVFAWRTPRWRPLSSLSRPLKRAALVKSEKLFVVKGLTFHLVSWHNFKSKQHNYKKKYILYVIFFKQIIHYPLWTISSSLSQCVFWSNKRNSRHIQNAREVSLVPQETFFETLPKSWTRRSLHHCALSWGTEYPRDHPRAGPASGTTATLSWGRHGPDWSLSSTEMETAQLKLRDISRWPASCRGWERFNMTVTQRQGWTVRIVVYFVIWLVNYLVHFSMWVWVCIAHSCGAVSGFLLGWPSLGTMFWVFKSLGLPCKIATPDGTWNLQVFWVGPCWKLS